MKPSIELVVPFLLPVSPTSHNAINKLIEKKRIQKLENILARSKIIEIKVGNQKNLACAHEDYLVDIFGFPEAKDGKIAPFLFLKELNDPEKYPTIRHIVDSFMIFKNSKIHLAENTYCGCIEFCSLQANLTGVSLLINKEKKNIENLQKKAYLLLSNAGLDIVIASQERWFIFTNKTNKKYEESFNALSGLESGSLIRTHGNNCQIFLPMEKKSSLQKERENNPHQKRRSRWWLRLQNEITIDSQKTESKELFCNQIITDALWLYGIGPFFHCKQKRRNSEKMINFSKIFSDQELTRGLAIANSIPYQHLQSNWHSIQNIVTKNGNYLIEFDNLIKKITVTNPMEWMEAIETLENNWLKPLLSSLQKGHISSLTLTLTSDVSTIKFTMNRYQAMRIWLNKKINSSEELTAMLYSKEK